MNSTSLDDLQLQNGQSFGDIFSSNNNKNSTNNNNIDESNPLHSDGMSWQDSSSSAVSSTINPRLTPILNSCSLSPVLPRSSVNNTPALMNPIASVFETPAASPAFSTASTSSLSSNAAPINQFINRSPVPLPPSAVAILSDSPNNSLISASPPPTITPAPAAPLIAAVAPTVSTNTDIAAPSSTQSASVAVVILFTYLFNYLAKIYHFEVWNHKTFDLNSCSSLKRYQTQQTSQNQSSGWEA